jgi:hypothetical protein
MTDELKTLKDIQEYEEKEEIGNAKPFVYSMVLRQEAIKWVKDAEYKIKQHFPTTPMTHYYQGQINILIEFFNLTEEDLEEKELGEIGE